MKSQITTSVVFGSCHASKQTVTLLLLTCLCSTALAQNYVIEYESPLGFRLALAIEPFETDRLDFNGDGTAELILLRVNEPNKPTEMVVVDLKSDSILWTFDVQALAAGFRFKGFFDIDGDSVREPAFFSRDASTFTIIDPKTKTPEQEITGVARATVADIDNDGQQELIVGIRDTQTVRVYGSGDTGTATEDDIARALLHLAQSYPNPFRQSTTIDYTVEQAAPVTLDIYDLLGRRIRTLVEAAQQGPGPHRAVWDGRDDSGTPVSSGTYFYRLRVGDAVTSKQALRVK